VIDVIDSLKKLLAYVNPGNFGQMILNYVAFQSKAEQKETISLDLNGYVIYVYKKIFKESFPIYPTPEQKQRINAIWDAIGHPENKLP
jgi:hypothetical protein